MFSSASFYFCIQTPYPGLVHFGSVCGAATSQARLCMPEYHELHGEAHAKRNGIDHGSVPSPLHVL